MFRFGFDHIATNNLRLVLGEFGRPGNIDQLTQGPGPFPEQLRFSIDHQAAMTCFSFSPLFVAPLCGQFPLTLFFSDCYSIMTLQTRISPTMKRFAERHGVVLCKHGHSFHRDLNLPILPPLGLQARRSMFVQVSSHLLPTPVAMLRVP